MISRAEQMQLCLNKWYNLNRFEGSHDIVTPLPLVNEILDQMPPEQNSMSMLVLFNIEWVIAALYSRNGNPENITFYSDHPNKTKFVEAMGVRVINNLMDMRQKYDIIVGNPPFNDTDTLGINGKRKQGKNLSKLFFYKTIELAKSYIILIAHYSNRTYSSGARKHYQKNGLYKVEDCQKHFPGIGANCSTFYFNKTRYSDIIVDDKLIEKTVPVKNLAWRYRINPSRIPNRMLMQSLSDTGKYRVILTPVNTKFTDDAALIARMADKTAGTWRLVFNTVGSCKNILIARPEDTLGLCTVSLTVSSEEEAVRLKSYLEQPAIQELINETKTTATISKKMFSYIPDPLVE